MKYLEYIPNLWFRFRATTRIFLRKIKYSFSGRDLKVNVFTYHAANTKGLLIIKYQCDGLLYTEILSKKYFNLSNTIILNLEKIAINTPIAISFVGLRNTLIEKIAINDILQTDFEQFRTKIKVKKLEMTDLSLAQSKNTLRYKLNETSITIKSPKLKFR